jgi:hypothetical protein
MTKSTTGLPLTISLQIPTYWTQQQALAVYELVNDLRDAIWQHYQLQLLDEYRDQLKPAVDCTKKQADDPPF